MVRLPPFTHTNPTQPENTLPAIPDTRHPPLADSTSDVLIPGGAVTDKIGGISKYLLLELEVKRINDVHRHLWWAGRPGNIRALHRQNMMHRKIIITECPNLHLVWYDSTIYIKPMPEYLRDWQFFNKYICPDEELYKLACGFLLSYSKLIRHQSDFNIAKDAGLLPGKVDWPDWCLFASDIGNILPKEVNKRYRYGELRLRRLNQISNFCRREMTYYSVYTQYDHFFTQNFAWLLMVFAFITIVLTAMQVVLATPDSPKPFGRASYWFGVFSIIFVLVGSLMMLVLFVALFTYNMIATLRHKQKNKNEAGTKYIKSKGTVEDFELELGGDQGRYS